MTTTAPPSSGRSGLLQRSAVLRATRQAPPVPAGGRTAWLVVAACTWILVGLFLDGWSHIDRGDSDGESFFTVWHALLYSGVAAAVAVHAWDVRRADGVRPGFGLSLVGGVVVLVAGVVDGAWHTLLGVEADLDALLSPPHLLLITAGTLVFAGPLRVALLRGTADLPAAFSAAFVVTGLSFFTQYANPFTHLYPVAGYVPVDAGALAAPAGTGLNEVAGVAGVVVAAALLGGAVAVVRALGPLPLGAVAVVVAVPALFMTTLRGTYVLVPAILLAALLAELLGRRLRPAPLAAAASTLLLGGWAATLLLARDVAWSLEAVGGAVGSAAAAAYLAGWLVTAGARAPRAA